MKLLINPLTFIILIAMEPRAAFGAVQLRIPFKEDCDSKFIFHLEQFDDEKMLDCTGEIHIRNLTDNLVFNFRNLKVHRNVNLNKSRVKTAASLPVIMLVGEKKLYDPKDYDDWDWIDPRIIVKIMKYTAVDEFGRVREESWEVSDLECPATVNTTSVDDNCSRLELVYPLQDCIDPVEDEIIEDHHRVIKFSVDKSNDLITRIEYHYEKTNKEFDKQNNAQIVFQGFVGY